MRIRSLRPVGIAALLLLFLGSSTVEAQVGGPTNPPVQRRQSPAGATVVNYYNNGGLTSETNVPTDSRFWTSGAGSGGGAPVPCGETRSHEQEPFDPDGPDGPEPEGTREVEIVTPSLNWRYVEIDEIPRPTDPAIPFYQGSFGRGAREVFGSGVPLGDAARRFQVTCELGPGNGLNLPFIDVAMTDPFWNPLDRLGLLWNSVELPDFRVATPVQAETFGGLVVNMPTWLQIEAAAWQPYFSPVDSYKGWDSQLRLYPASLEFAVVGAGGATVPCAPEFGTGADGGVTPARPDDLPRYATHGQVDGYSCTWVPKQVGDVTVRATITYDVLLTISGYSEWLSPYSWSSDPLTLETNELRFVNVKPQGGG